MIIKRPISKIEGIIDGETGKYYSDTIELTLDMVFDFYEKRKWGVINAIEKG